MGETIIDIHFCYICSEAVGVETTTVGYAHIKPAYMVVCPICGTRGPKHLTQEDAVLAWNNVCERVDRAEERYSLLAGILANETGVMAAAQQYDPVDTLRALISVEKKNRNYMGLLRARAERAEAALALLGEIRPEVWRFARIMEEKLRENDHKGGWKQCQPDYLIERIFDEFKELILARREGKNVAAEAADVANFCMMLADVMGMDDNALQAIPDTGDDPANDPQPEGRWDHYDERTAYDDAVRERWQLGEGMSDY